MDPWGRYKLYPFAGGEISEKLSNACKWPKMLSVELGFGNGLIHLTQKFILFVPISLIGNSQSVL